MLQIFDNIITNQGQCWIFSSMLKIKQNVIKYRPESCFGSIHLFEIESSERGRFPERENLAKYQ